RHRARDDGPRARRQGRGHRASYHQRRADRRPHRRVRTTGDPAQSRSADDAVRRVPRAHARVTLAKSTLPDILETPEWRVEGRDKVTGAARYAADITRPGMLHAAFVGSPFPHARVASVDVEAARKMPGVRAVLTGADVRPARFGRRLQDWPALARDPGRLNGARGAAGCGGTGAGAGGGAGVPGGGCGGVA